MVLPGTVDFLTFLTLDGIQKDMKKYCTQCAFTGGKVVDGSDPSNPSEGASCDYPPLSDTNFYRDGNITMTSNPPVKYQNLT